jgi:hypothetical protein
MTDDSKTCPVCGETTKAAAGCRFCDTDLAALAASREVDASPATPTSHLPATRRRLYGNFATRRRNVIPSGAPGYRIASLFPGAAAFLTSLSSSTPLSYVASQATSSSSTGSVKLR